MLLSSFVEMYFALKESLGSKIALAMSPFFCLNVYTHNSASLFSGFSKKYLLLVYFGKPTGAKPS